MADGEVFKFILKEKLDGGGALTGNVAILSPKIKTIFNQQEAGKVPRNNRRRR